MGPCLVLKGGFDFRDEFFQALGGGGPLGLLGGEVVGGVADLTGGGVDLVGGGLLLLGDEDRLFEHGGGRAHQVADVAGLGHRLLGGHDGGVGLVLDAGDDLADGAGGGHGALGEVADLGGDHGESLACLAGPGGLDGGVEGEQVGLPGDVVDQLEDLADPLGPLAERQRAVGDGLDLFLHVAHGAGGVLGVLGDGADGVGDGAGGGRQFLDGGRCLGDGGGLLAGGGGGAGGGGAQLARDLAEHPRRRPQPGQQLIAVAELASAPVSSASRWFDRRSNRTAAYAPNPTAAASPSRTTMIATIRASSAADRAAACA